MQIPAEQLQAAAARLEAAGIEQGRMEAQLLLALALGVSRTAILAGTYPGPTPSQWQMFETLLEKRAARIPLAYLRGTQEFYGLEFSVSPDVLIPRPETELLVDFALEKLGEGKREEDKEKREPTREATVPCFADVGTGSGCIAIAILAQGVRARGVAVDLSEEALAVSIGNSVRNGVTDRLRFLRDHLLTALSTDSMQVIVSNPPYIPLGEIEWLQREVRDWEPRLALAGGADGLELVRLLASQALRVLRSGGWLGIEIAQGQASQVKALFETIGLVRIESRKDLAGIERVVCAQKGTA